MCCSSFSHYVMFSSQTTPVLFNGTSYCRDDSTSLRTGSVSIATSSAGKHWYALCSLLLFILSASLTCVIPQLHEHSSVVLQLTVRLKDICSMTKEKTARLIPNAIQVSTDNEKVTLAARVIRLISHRWVTIIVIPTGREGICFKCNRLCLKRY